jgi:hypothetical protein
MNKKPLDREIQIDPEKGIVAIEARDMQIINGMGMAIVMTIEDVIRLGENCKSEMIFKEHDDHDDLN